METPAYRPLPRRPSFRRYSAPTPQPTRGFTLIELLIVISIIALLSSLVLVAITKAQQGTRQAATEVEVGNMNSALENYYSDEAKYPGMDQPIDEDDPNQFPLLFEALFGRKATEGGGGGRNAPYMDYKQDKARVWDPDVEDYVQASREQLKDVRAKKYLVDGWGVPYSYRANKGRRPQTYMRNEGKADLYSFGPNNEDDTWAENRESDDIGNW